MNDEIDQFLEELKRQQLAHYTIENYASDLRVFARFFHGSMGEEFQAGRVTPTDVRDFKSHQVAVEQRSPATVNRRIYALRKFFHWAIAAGLAKEDPTAVVKGVQSRSHHDLLYTYLSHRWQISAVVGLPAGCRN